MYWSSLVGPYVKVAPRGTMEVLPSDTAKILESQQGKKVDLIS